jgi:hypothetical protein
MLEIFEASQALLRHGVELREVFLSSGCVFSAVPVSTPPKRRAMASRWSELQLSERACSDGLPAGSG